MKTHEALLANTPLFGGLPPDQLQAIRQIARIKHYHKGEMIFSEGDEGNGFYIVIQGKLKIYKVSPEGKEQILHIFGPGEPFGEVPVFSGNPFPANAQTLVESRVFFLPRKAFVELVADNPSLAMNMLAVLSRRLRQFTEQIENLSLREVPARLAAYLLYLYDKNGEKSEVVLEVSKGQLASLLGTIPETLSRMLSRMVKAGLISVRGRTIRLRNLDKLMEISGSGKVREGES